MKTLVFLLKGFETMEFSPFIDVFGWARHDFGLPVEIETCGFTSPVISTFNISVIPDNKWEDLQIEEYDALAIPGGFEDFGFYEEAYSEPFQNLIRSFYEQDKIIASICVGALSIGKTGILKGRRGTTYHLDGGKRQQQLKDFGVHVVNEPVVVDQKIITSYCPETAPHVAFQLLEMLTSKKETDSIRKAMGW